MDEFILLIYALALFRNQSKIIIQSYVMENIYLISIYLRKLRVSVHGLAGIVVPLYLYFTPSSPYAAIVQDKYVNLN